MGLKVLGKINFLPIKTVAGKWDTKIKTRPPCSFILYTLWVVSARGWGMRVSVSPYQFLSGAPSSLLQGESSTGYSPSGWTFCSVGSSLQASVPSGCIHLLWCGVLHRLQGNSCSTMAHSISNRQICSSTWGTSSHSICSDLGICRIASHTCTSSVLTTCEISYFFFNVFSQKCHQLNRQDQLFLGGAGVVNAGPGWTQPCLAWGSPSFSGHLLRVPHCQNLHTYIQCKQYTKNI